MASGPVHMMAGCGAGLVVACLDDGARSEDSHNLFMAGMLGAFGGKLPDLLEPALHAHHRQFFHSFLVLGAVGYGLKKAYDWQPQDRIEAILRLMALAVGCAYASHLLLDSLTRRSLPLVGKL